MSTSTTAPLSVEARATTALATHPLSGAVVPESVNRFTVLELIGSGGEGSVYLGHDPQLDRPVAIKRLHASTTTPLTGGAKRLAREAQILALLNHANVVRVYELTSDEHAEYVVSEYVEGTTLDELQRHTLSLSRKLAIALQIAQGLQHAHARGVWHRDLKPNNILIDKDGTAKITDFGIALLQRETAQPRSVVPDGLLFSGTPCAMAPEQTLGLPGDQRSDIFSLGLLYYELFTASRAFDGASSVGIAAKIRSAAHVPAIEVNAVLSPKLSRLIDRMLQKEPASRPQDLADVIQVLGEISEQQRAVAASQDTASLDASCPLVGVVHCECDLPTHVDKTPLSEMDLGLSLELESLAAGVAERLEVSIVAVYAGRVVVCVGYPQPEEQIARVALQFAYGLERALYARAAASGLAPLSLRCGVSLGRVLVRDGIGNGRRAWAGPGFERAAALCQIAKAGQPVVDAAAQAQLPSGVDAKPLGRVHVHANVQPCAAFALQSLSAAAAVGGGITKLEARPLVGRANSFARLRSALAEANGGGRIHLYGPTGIGKSQLVRSVLAARELAGLRRGSVQASPSCQYQAFWGVTALLEELLGLVVDADLAQREPRALMRVQVNERLNALGLAARYAASPLWELWLAPASAERLGIDSHGRYRTLLDAAVAMLTTLSEQRSLLLVIEDSQWLDHSSREVLTTLCTHVSPARLRLLSTARTADDGFPDAVATELEPLSNDAAQDFLDKLALEPPLSAHERQRVIEAAEGVPLVLEVLAAQSGRSEPTLTGLASLEAAVAARLQEHAEPRRVAEFAAVLGRTVSVDMLELAMTASAEFVSDALQTLERLQLFTRRATNAGDEWSFSHGMVRDAINQMMPAARRLSLHAAVVELFARGAGQTAAWPLAMLAFHCDEAGQCAAAAAHYQTAARVAIDTGAYFEARRLLENALVATAKLATTSDGQPTLERDLRTLYSQCLVASEGWSSTAKRNNHLRILQLNQQLGTAATAADSMGRFTVAMFSDDPAGAQAAIAEMEGLAGDPAVRFVVTVIKGYFAFFTGRWGDALYQSDAAIELRAKLDQDAFGPGGVAGCGLELLGVAELQAAAVEFAQQRPHAAARYLATAPGSKTVAEPGVLELTFLGYSVTHALMLSHLSGGRERLNEMALRLHEMASAQRNALYCTFADLGSGYAQVLAGELAAGLQLLQRSHQSLDAMGMGGGLRLHYDCFYIDALLRAGRHEAAQALVDERWQVALGELSNYCRPDFLVLAARARACAADAQARDSALSLLDDAIVATKAIAACSPPGASPQLALGKIKAAYAELTTPSQEVGLAL